MQRKLNFHLYMKDSVRYLHVHEITEAGSGSDEPGLGRMLDSLVSFNRFTDEDDENMYLFMNKYINQQLKEITEVDKVYPFTNYSIVECRFVLPLEIKEAFEFIGGVDGFLSNMIYRAKNSNELLEITFDAITEATDLNAYCHNAFHVKKSINNILPEKLLSRRIAEFLQAEAMKIANAMADLLAVADSSLSYPIRMKLYPDTSLKDFIAKKQITDPLYIEMLDPDVAYPVVTAKLIAKLKTMLAVMTIPAETEDQKNHNLSIKQGVDAYINEFEKLSREFWITKVESLFGIDAADGGKYNVNYTEVALLMEADFKINESGLMYLEYRTSNTEPKSVSEKTAYEMYYAKGMDNHAILEEELRLACQHMGLYFLPNIDFHKGAIFDQASSIKLFNLGLHYSVDYVKSLMREMHHSHLIKQVQIPEDVKSLFFKAVDPRLQSRELSAVAKLPKLP